jgi:hypothetical protein
LRGIGVEILKEQVNNNIRVLTKNHFI